MANEQELGRSLKEAEQKKRVLQPQMSPLVSGIIEMMQRFGLKYVTQKAHIAFKIDGRNIFGITAFKAKDLNGLLKVIYTRDRSQFPESILTSVTTDTVGGYYCVEADSLEQLEPLVKSYLEHITGETVEAKDESSK